MSEKRPLEELPKFDDPIDLINAVVSTLHAPQERTNVSITYSNEKNVATEVQAYAKIAGCDWTYYVKTLLLTIGRNTEVSASLGLAPQQTVDIDLGLAKVVSRQHAVITYNIDTRCWELKVLGRNGARMDGVKMAVGPQHAAPLHLGAILDVGGTQMMFILPDAPPSVLQKMLTECMARYRPEKNKFPRISHDQGALTSQLAGQYLQSAYQQNSGFLMFEKGLLAHSPSSVSAVSLQNNLDQDLSKEDSKDIKPPYSYATMITQAILSNADGVMSLAEIYAWISSHYAYYKYSKTGWQNSIRHNLSLNKAFEKVPRRPNEPGKGMKWQISELYRLEFLKKIQNGTLLKSRRGLSVSRTLQIHLATHQGLPELKGYPKTDSNGGVAQVDQMYQAMPPQQQQQHQQIPQDQQHLQQQQMLLQQQPLQMDKVNLGQPMTNLGPQYGRPPPGMMMQPGYMSQQLPQNGYLTTYGNPVYQQRLMMYGASSAPNQGIVGNSGNGSNNGGASNLPPSHNQVPNQAHSQIPNQLSNQANQSHLSNQNMHNPQQGMLPQAEHLDLMAMRQGPSNESGKAIKDENGSMYLPGSNHLKPETPNYLPGLPSKALTTQPPNYELPVSENAGHTSFSNTSNIPNTSESVQSSTAPTTSNTTELGLGFTSPKKIAPLEAFTPERGSKAGAKNPAGTNQSSPAFWNFVQFSTPNGQTPGRKNSEESNVQVSPTLARRTTAKIEDAA